MIGIIVVIFFLFICCCYVCSKKNNVFVAALKDIYICSVLAFEEMVLFVKKIFNQSIGDNNKADVNIHEEKKIQGKRFVFKD